MKADFQRKVQRLNIRPPIIQWLKSREYTPSLNSTRTDATIYFKNKNYPRSNSLIYKACRGKKTIFHPLKTVKPKRKSCKNTQRERERESRTHQVRRKGWSSLLMTLSMILSLVTTSNLGPGNWPLIRITCRQNQTQNLETPINKKSNARFTVTTKTTINPHPPLGERQEETKCQKWQSKCKIYTGRLPSPKQHSRQPKLHRPVAAARVFSPLLLQNVAQNKTTTTVNYVTNKLNETTSLVTFFLFTFRLLNSYAC